MPSYFVKLQADKRVSLSRIAKLDSYLVHEEPDGILVWEPAQVISETKRKLLQDTTLMTQILTTRSNPARLRQRSR